MARGYWGRVHRQAIADAGRELHIESRGRLVIVLLGAVAAIVALAFWGSSDASRDEMIARVAIGGIVVLLFPFVYLWKFLGTPARLEQELETRLSARIDEQAVQISALHEQMKPRIEFAPEIQHDDDGATEHTWIVVHNPGSEIQEKCSVKIEYITDSDGKCQEEQVALVTKARLEDGRPGRFFLSGGERKRIMLTAREKGNPRHPGLVRIASERGEYILSRGAKFVVDLIAATEIGLPSRATIELTVDDNYAVSAQYVNVD